MPGVLLVRLAESAANNTTVVAATITTVGVVISTFGVALLRISRLSHKTDEFDLRTGARLQGLQVQVNGQMSAILAQLKDANDARVVAERELAIATTKLADYEERSHEPTPDAPDA